MALSPNYGWAEPDNSSLVKNGAQDIRALGDAIDTSVWNVGYGQAGKNKIINGDFTINQRTFTSTTVSGTFGHDRWQIASGGGTVTYSTQAFTAGTAPVAGYEATNYARVVTSGQSAVGDFGLFRQLIENVRTFAGQTVTVSFWAKAASGTPKIAAELRQNFGTGGSPSTTVENPLGTVTLSTSWARYLITYALPSISGKTIGTDANTSSIALGLWVSAGSTFATRSSSIGIQNNTFDIWGVQVEYGSQATPFQTATGTIQGELAACQRYYYRQTAPGAYTVFATGGSTGSTNARFAISYPVQMRVAPTSLDYSTLAVAEAGGSVIAATSAALDGVLAVLITVSSGLTQYRSNFLYSNNSTSAYIGFSAEL
jgi:hypothetical protein